MTPKTPLGRSDSMIQWLAAKIETGPCPVNGNRRQQVAWLRARRHNLITDIGASKCELRKCQERDELFVKLSDVKQQASTALRTLATLLRPNALKDFNERLHRFEAQYDTLSGSVAYVFLVMAPDLARRAESLR